MTYKSMFRFYPLREKYDILKGFYMMNDSEDLADSEYLSRCPRCNDISSIGARSCKCKASKKLPEWMLVRGNIGTLSKGDVFGS